jgi:FkbM family methyltransferase
MNDPVISDLVYDVGMNNGDDTAYYLHRGYRVVAIEADPEIAQECEVRFRQEIATGRLTILNVAVGPQPGVAQFCIYLDHSHWNSFSQGRAAAAGLRTKMIDVTVRPFNEILAEFGIPHYLKIDIEGSDLHCLQGLRPEAVPTYISLELTELDDLLALRDLGYDRFKIVLQRHHRPLPDHTRSFAGWCGRLAQSSAVMSRAAAWLDNLGGKVRRGTLRLGERLGLARPADWHFPHGSSGPFGEESPGPWLTVHDASLRWLDFHRLDPATLWCDVHATKSPAAATVVRQAA